MLSDYMALGGVEIVNTTRLAAYAETVGTALTSGPVCGCPTLTAEGVGDEPYSTPEEDGAPWWDPAVPESSDFAGWMVTSVEGLDDHPVQRQVTGAVIGGAALGPARVQPRTITITGVLLGATCCGVAYGLRWLAWALEGCTGVSCGTCGGGGCGGSDLTVLACCPPPEDVQESPGWDSPGEESPEESLTESPGWESPGWESPGDESPGEAGWLLAPWRRTLRRVALLEGPRVIERAGEGCTGRQPGGCDTGADLVTVEVVLSAATPWAWSDPVEVLHAPVPSDDGSECITWCVHSTPGGTPPVCLELTDSACPEGAVAVVETDGACGGVAWPADEGGDEPCTGTCRHAACPEPGTACADPACRTPTPPTPPPPRTCFCSALAVNAEAYELDLTDWPRTSPAVPIITVEAGSADLRRLTVSFFQRRPEHDGMTCEEVADAERCTPHSVYEVAFVPAGGEVRLDGQTGRATVTCDGVCETSPDAYGAGGSPLAFELLKRGEYCVLLEADAIVTPADDATVTIELSGREW
jgi:hypothetical protein